ncbi:MULTISPECIES: nucleotidyltransferase domain-containing protein [unclassified Synechococcus]|jgi:predicted nucleotidyltransferase|uniref:nucleotidyltransferase domain-containing protein n=1 Tax=unclassified Synechococcus TaxID=2626047 RepID=UPI0018CE8075|nr:MULTISPECIES: nucleotidyltransferase domain-containing protein [unclassified Synechococcus]MEA5421757.1 nucleotidyltransferase domain-containing protein [Synechococcus sp. CCY9202]QPN60564.1 nucleotidyltransferase domain-containing protein [Synechococcus sp. CBW1002]QPN67725.1 nucleotidyltransferase domain-containing protein [Synechococcus sp. CBW1006]
MTTAPTYAISETQLQQMAAEIRQEIPGAEVRLFGSRARGDAGSDSDVDLLITASDSWLAQHNRFDTLGRLWRKLSHHRIPVDLLLYSQSQVEERRQWLSHVIARAYREGRLLHGQP